MSFTIENKKQKLQSEIEDETKLEDERKLEQQMKLKKLLKVKGEMNLRWLTRIHFDDSDFTHIALFVIVVILVVHLFSFRSPANNESKNPTLNHLSLPRL